MPLPLLFLLAAQITPVKPLPKANPLPLADIDTRAVMAPIDAMFAGLAARDGAAILAQVRTEGGATVVREAPDGTRTIKHLSWADFAGGIKPGPEHYEERLTDPAIEVDGDIAMVWSPYVFTVDGRAHHCGVDHFDLVREGDGWKVLNVTWSQRTTGCEVAK
ncbi:hypothetical protein FHS31_000066 [Sphingomonas vulcanisoli]|uniref:Nuclear transport factor 2 family protein n=2 Tax=Sphingomonas vulcanisoli TaxID=1658060 RepID=A0ABX0TQQ7_9SPHN|nr:hypothetical protein [Sphingomonas vulcanisoli]